MAAQLLRSAGRRAARASQPLFCGRGHSVLPSFSRTLTQFTSRSPDVLEVTDASTATVQSVPSLPFSRGFAADSVALPTMTNAVELARKNPNSTIQYDEYNHERLPAGDPGKKAFTYMVIASSRFIYASALRLLLLKFILSMSASKDVLALASLEVDLSNIEPGNTITVKWRGKPVFIRRRTTADIEKANDVNLKELRDPQPDAVRAKNPEWLVVIGVCTHLGCVPLPNAGDYGGWFCPCHGSHYDISGRIRKGPAPWNLEVPEYKFLDDGKLLVG